VAVVVVAIAAIATATAVLYLGEPATIPNITVTALGCDDSGDNAQYTFTLVNSGVSGFADVGLVTISAVHVIQSHAVNNTYFVSSNSQAIEGIDYGYTCFASGHWSVVIVDEHR
jgi:hypothetical protein